MNCPACEHDLDHLDAGGGLFLDVCAAGCGGVWFDNHELAHFDEASERAASPVFEVAPGDEAGRIERGKRLCPRCPGQKMGRHWFSVKRQVEVDECPACGGDWLDYNELQTIRSEFETADDREDAAMASYGALFDAQLGDVRAETEAHAARVERFVSIFRILSPSRWFS